MPQTPNPSDSQSPEPTTPYKRTPQSWQTLADERIREAMAQGAFDNLPNAGKPLPLDDNPYAGDRAMAFRVLKSHGALPRELELGREADAEMAQAERLLLELRHRRDTLTTKRIVTARDRRAYNIALAKARERYEAILREARNRILTLNISAPPALHREMPDSAALLRAFDDEFPPVAETDDKRNW